MTGPAPGTPGGPAGAMTGDERGWDGACSGPPHEHYWTVREAAVRLGVSRSTLFRRVQRGDLVALRVTAGGYLIAESELQRYAAEPRRRSGR
jgi:excisionase family DNA binding protein